jgi:hypothetical protein
MTSTPRSRSSAVVAGDNRAAEVRPAGADLIPVCGNASGPFTSRFQQCLGRVTLSMLLDTTNVKTFGGD